MALGLLLLPTGAGADGTRFAPVTVPSKDLGAVTGAGSMSAAGGHVVFSRFVAAKTVELVDWSAAGGFRTLTAAGTRPTAFDADAGVDSRGRPVVAFSDCSRAKRCTLRTLRLDRSGARPERLRLRGDSRLSLTTPSVRGDGVAAVAAPETGKENVRILHWRTRRTAPRRLSGGTATCPFYAPCDGDAPTRVQALDLGRQSVAFIWEVDAAYSGISSNLEVRSAPLDGGHSAQASGAYGYISGACGYRKPDSPNALPGGGVGFVLSQSPCEVDQTAIARLPRGADDFEGARPKDTLVGGAAWDGDRIYWLSCPPVRDPDYGADVLSTSCRLVVSSAVPFGPRGRRPHTGG